MVRPIIALSPSLRKSVRVVGSQLAVWVRTYDGKNASVSVWCVRNPRMQTVMRQPFVTTTEVYLQPSILFTLILLNQDGFFRKGRSSTVSSRSSSCLRTYFFQCQQCEKIRENSLASICSMNRTHQKRNLFFIGCFGHVFSSPRYWQENCIFC